MGNPILYLFGLVFLMAFGYIVWDYAKGLRGSPRELWIMFIAKLFEYAAYGAMNLTFVLFLSSDCGMGDIAAGSYIGTWSMILTVTTILVGPVVDAIGIKKTLLTGIMILFFSRFFMPFVTNIYVISLLGFLPMAIGLATMGPVLSVGIKRYTTKEGAALGFGLFYTLMNVGWALGAWIFDKVRFVFGETNHTAILGFDLSTYQLIFFVGLVLTIPNIILILVMRDGVEMTEKGPVITPPKARDENVSFLSSFLSVTKKAASDTVSGFKSVIGEKAFWYFMLMLGILVFVRLVFYHFHYTFPKYGIRVLGEGIKIGNIYGLLNPVMIVFLVPLVSTLTKKVSSYKMMMVGTFISAFAVFIATIPAHHFDFLMNTWVSDLIFNTWLEVPVDKQSSLFFVLIFFVIIFTIGEAIWSPRLLQFNAEIAPKGKEGTYISLAYLPFFASKFVAGPLSGWLLATYVPKDATSYPDHYMVWIWIGGMAIISPLGLLLLKKMFIKTESEIK